MRKLFYIFAVVTITTLFTGCTTAGKAIDSAAQKNLSGSGYASIQKVNSMYDSTTGTPGASVLSIIGNLRYKSTIVSVPEGHKVPDSADYTREDSVSIWNSNARTTNVSFSFTASTPEAAKERFKEIITFDAAQQQAAQAEEAPHE